VPAALLLVVGGMNVDHHHGLTLHVLPTQTRLPVLRLDLRRVRVLMVLWGWGMVRVFEHHLLLLLMVLSALVLRHGNVSYFLYTVLLTIRQTPVRLVHHGPAHMVLHARVHRVGGGTRWIECGARRRWIWYRILL